jgi:hypothetical protein
MSRGSLTPCIYVTHVFNVYVYRTVVVHVPKLWYRHFRCLKSVNNWKEAQEYMRVVLLAWNLWAQLVQISIWQPQIWTMERRLLCGRCAM